MLRSDQIWFMAMRKKAVTLLTEPLFFDTDCLSAFLWINNQSLLAQLYPARVIIPAQVYAELVYADSSQEYFPEAFQLAVSHSCPSLLLRLDLPGPSPPVSAAILQMQNLSLQVFHGQKIPKFIMIYRTG